MHCGLPTVAGRSPHMTGDSLREEVMVNGKIRTSLGSGVTVTRHALDVEFGVRIPAPQPKTHPNRWVVGLKGKQHLAEKYTRHLTVSLSLV